MLQVQDVVPPDYNKFHSWNDMGRVYAEIDVIASDDLALVRKGYLNAHEVRKMPVKFLVDSGADYLAINEHIKTQLNLAVLEERVFQLADGQEITFEVVGPVDLRFFNRQCTCRAVVLPGNAEPLLGAIPMEDMDVIIHPKSFTLSINPDNPYIAKHNLK